MLKLDLQERMYLIKRRHPVTLKLQIFPLLLIFSLIVLLILILFFQEIKWPEFLIQQFPQLLKYRLNILLIFLLSLFLPIVWSLIFLNIMFFYLTYWVITNQRIIFVQLKGFFNFESVGVFYDKIQDVTVLIKGFFPSFFHFGDVRIQTAGEKGQFFLDSIPEPEITKQVILEAQRDYLKTWQKQS